MFVSIVNIKLTGAESALNCASLKIRIDSKEVAEWLLRFCGSADSKGVARRKRGFDLLQAGVFSRDRTAL